MGFVENVNNVALEIATIDAKVATVVQAVADTAADVVLTHADVVLTGLDVIITNADVLSTNSNAASTAADVLVTNADVLVTNADKIATNADVVITNADVIQTAADRAQTGLDVIATAADRVITTQDALDTAADVVLTHADVVSSGTNATNAAQSELDAEDSNLEAGSWANENEDVNTKTYLAGTPTSTSFFSAKHWAAKAATFNPALYALLTGATFTGQVKGITPVAIDDLTRKDYVDLKAPLASPALTGTPLTTTAAADTSTTQIASTAFVTNQAANVAPLMNGTATIGTSKRYARQDHKHPTDTTRALDTSVVHLANAETISGVKTFTAQPVGIVKASVGLSNVDNTSDVNKPVSTAQATALSGKVDKSVVITSAVTSITFNADGTVTIVAP